MTDLNASILIITLNVIEERIQKKSSTFTLKNQEIRTNGNSILAEVKEITKYQISVEVKSIKQKTKNVLKTMKPKVHGVRRREERALEKKFGMIGEGVGQETKEEVQPNLQKKLFPTSFAHSRTFRKERGDETESGFGESNRLFYDRIHFVTEGI